MVLYYRINALVIVQLFLYGTLLNSQLRFTDITDSAGIVHQFRVYEGMFGGGVSVFDANNDGYQDFYITGGMNDDKLYINDGNGSFIDRFEGSGLEITRSYVTQGVASADVNRDGWSDLFITTITSRDSVKQIPREINVLFLNNGDLTFTDVTRKWGLADDYSFSTGVSFGDINNDGYPDAFIGNYFLEYDGPLTEIKDATIVNASRTAKDYLYLNVKGRYFKEVSARYGMDHRGFGFGGIFTDFDNDQDHDIYIINDFGYKAQPNFLLRNDYPKRSVSYVEDTSRMDLTINAMAAAPGDYDGNGFMDYFVTNIRFNFFMVNEGGALGPFENKAAPLGMQIFTISWGASFGDFDHDGDLDLYVANGDLNPNCTPMGNFLFENEDGFFSDKGRASGTNDYGIGRGMATLDIENDGDLDIILVNQIPVKDYPVGSATRLFRNERNGGNWIKVALTGSRSETNGIGSRVKVVAGNTKMIRDVDGGASSHLSQNSPVVHFGLGQNVKIDSIVVFWTAGTQQIVANVDTNQTIFIAEPPETENLGYLIVIGLAAVGVMIISLIIWRMKSSV